MFISEITIKIKHSHTQYLDDIENKKLQYVHFSNYGTYYELAMQDILKKMGISYKIMENEGLLMPVISMTTKYRKPAFYGENITIFTMIRSLPCTRMRFDFEIINNKAELLNIGNTVHAFINRKNLRPVQVPDWFLNTVKMYL